jgi:hypothetical protein
MAIVIDFFVQLLQQKDKQQHIIISCAIMAACLIYLGIAQSLSLTFVIGIGKEIWDECYGTGFCWYDVLGNAMGILVAIGLHEIIVRFYT